MNRNKKAGRLTALVLCMTLLLTVMGCKEKTDLTWIAKDSDFTMPVGSYVYFLYNAYSTIDQALSNDALAGETYDVLASQYEGVAAEEYIRDYAKKNVDSYFWVEDQLQQRGIELTQEDLEYCDTATDSFWDNSSASLKALSIAKGSFSYAYARYNVMCTKLFRELYSLGGDFAVSDNELTAYYEETFTSYDMLTFSAYLVDKDGSTHVVTGEEKENYVAMLETYAEKLRTGEMTMTEIYKDALENVNSQDITRDTQVEDIRSNYSRAMEKLKTMESGEVAIEAFGTEYYLLYKGDITENSAQMLADASARQQALQQMKYQEFISYVYEQSADMAGVTFNQAAADSIDLTMFAKTE